MLAAIVVLVISGVQVLRASRTSAATSAVGPASAVIVVGTGSTGNVATGDSRRVCAQALALWRAHRVPLVITTGASATKGAPTEASLAGAWLLARGLPARDLDEMPDTSLSSALASIAKRDGKSAGARTILVGSPFQALWLTKLASAEGLEAQVSPAPAVGGLLTDVKNIWSQAVAVGLGRVIGYAHTQGFGA